MTNNNFVAEVTFKGLISNEIFQISYDCVAENMRHRENFW